MFRKVFFQLVSAHSGSGFSNLPVVTLAAWPQVALLVMIVAMAFGGSVGSTTGGIKLMRIALLFKTFLWEIRKVVAPQRVWILQKYHHIHTRILDDARIRAVFITTSLFCVSYFTGGVIGMFCGYPFLESLFESTSAAANVGLSVGITAPTMPAALKVVYIIQMWTGRLEFLAIIVGAGLIGSSFLRWRRARGARHAAA